ncbi:hypothetical protein KR51_00027970 [Rubidibacter lacunae KORDI 51-2]|uniref:Uncharacterized protein n=1 Tax=Rubidibacter lacunae KORDI 51-2 TaxID=582515 RepID=U5DIN8_9CHRO|nr:hypothetical protein [Rubidibacter lacunae]ERN40807.1 hypothetical protein KR51_00027970 [Rubidibacter lacunae KORDI 51-2]
MQLAQERSLLGTAGLMQIKSFLVWSFTLAICLLVVGFPLVAIASTAGMLLAVALQSVLPTSAVLVVGGGLIGGSIFAVFAGAAVLTLKGIHPHDVRWLHWLHGKDGQLEVVKFAACPLTCSIDRVAG